MRLPITLLLFTCLGGACAGQVITAEDFFSRPVTHPVADYSAEGGAPRMPWVERYELRTETRDFDAASQEYTFRLLPSTPGKRRAQQALSAAREGQPDFELAERACDVVEDRYEDWARLFHLTEEARYLDQLAAVLRDRETILGRMAGSLDFDWNELYKLRTDRTDLTLRAGEARSDRDRLLLEAGLSADSLSFADFPRPETLSFPTIGPAMPGATQLDEETALDLRLIELELELERAEQKQYIDFAQFKYRGPGDDLLRERFSVGVGFQLPNRGNDKLKIRELELERAETLRENYYNATQTATKQETYSVRLQSLLDDYTERRRLYVEEADYFSNLSAPLTDAAPAGPLFLLQIREREIRNALRLLEARLRITNLFIDALVNSESLCSEPEGAWLRSSKIRR